MDSETGVRSEHKQGIQLANFNLCRGVPPGWREPSMARLDALCKAVEEGYCPLCCSLLHSGRVWREGYEASLSRPVVRVPSLHVRIESVQVREVERVGETQLLFALRFDSTVVDGPENVGPSRSYTVRGTTTEGDFLLPPGLHLEAKGTPGQGGVGTRRSSHESKARYRFRLRAICFPGSQEPVGTGRFDVWYGRRPPEVDRARS